MSLDWKDGSCLLFFIAEFTAILYQKTVPISRSSICDIYLVIGESLNVLIEIDATCSYAHSTRFPRRFFNFFSSIFKHCSHSQALIINT